MMPITFRMASSKDIEKYYGNLPPPTMKAIVVCMDDEPKAVVGVARFHDHARYFSEFKPEFEPYMKSMTVLRAMKKSMEIVESHPMLVLSVADNPKLLERLGFVHLNEDVYRWPH